jgi:hypothetical protein
MTEKKAKLPYEPPVIRKVKLVRDETAAAICKTRTSMIGPTTGCFRSNCKARGS